ncbi:EAL domain-containing protein [Paraburkholderia dinghuensis]|uniref:EAL domain-containing protein n=1 Tax=Paraburkholderia dinghuensis TaxID=2305225 RepID=UPI001623D51F|nr:EAL domain-containing protein [Paraburkholderia dinghuensis]
MLILVALAPLLACVVICYYAAGRTERREAAIAANIIVSEVSAIVEVARSAMLTIVPHADYPCEKLLPDLAVKAATAPYVRTINVIKGDVVFCSSAFGKLSIPLSTFMPDIGHERGGEWMALVGMTPMVPERQALVIGKPAAGGRAVMAVIDGRYLLDLMRAAAPLDMYRQAELRFAGSPPLDGARMATPLDESSLLVNTRKVTASGAFELRIYGLRERWRATFIALMLRDMPWAVALSALLVWLVWRLQNSRSSRREQLLRGIRANEFHVEYQPLYGVSAGHCDGAEALLRWVRPEFGEVRPGEFITAAEDEHVIVPLTQHLLKLIARDFATMDVRPGFHLSINFSPEHLSSEKLTDDVNALLETVSKNRPQIVMEITERTLIKNTEQAQRNLEALRDKGVKVAIDDFGTGYCSLTYLEHFPLDLLKIDRGFVLTIEPGTTRAVVLDAIIDLALSLDAQLVAEGVETMAQFDYLCARGVGFVQGYLYAKSMTADAFAQWYRTLGSQPLAAVTVTSAQ